MKRFIQITLFVFCLSTMLAMADKKSDNLQRKSELKESVAPGVSTSYPAPFNELSQKNSRTTASISTGYYFYDNLEKDIDVLGHKDIWKPEPYLHGLTYQEKYWHRIIQGPRIKDKSFWEGNQYGKYYFRNPADELDGSLFDHDRDDMDSTDNSIAGPISLGIRNGFYYNGIRYDSFYVSTNGVIALTNRRYIYDENGKKEIPQGANHCYDVNSMDWFVGGGFADYPTKTRLRTDNLEGTPADGTKDAIADDFGYMNSVLARDPYKYYETPVGDPYYDKQAGIRNDGMTSGTKRLNSLASAKYPNNMCRPTLISPFWGQLVLSQYNRHSEKAEDHGKVYFKYSPNSDKLVVAFMNVAPWGVLRQPGGNNYTVSIDERLNSNLDNGYVEWDANIVFDAIDSSITFVYKDLRGTSKNGASCGDVIRYNTISGLMGWARHTNYSTKNPDQEVDETNRNYPWAGEYMQYTHYFSNLADGIGNNFPYNETTVKFKQWKNTVRAVDIAYRVRSTANVNNPNYNFTNILDNTDGYEILAGVRLIGAVQPIGMVQNLANDIQGPKGVNFVPQDYQYTAQFRFRNVTTGRIVYNKTLPITAKCMELDGNWADCYNEQGAKVRLVNSTNTSYSLGSRSFISGAAFKSSNFTGVPSYYMAHIEYPAFEPNEFVSEQIGRIEGKLIVMPSLEGEDQWPFDDTLKTTLNVMKRLEEFADEASDFEVDITTGRTIPSTLRWVNINADVIDGNQISQHPMPPRGLFTETKSAIALNSPAIRMNRTRTNEDGVETDAGIPNTTVTCENSIFSGHGDELRSFPIDLRGKYGAIVSLSVQRGYNYYNGWISGRDRFTGERGLWGPEAKVFQNGSKYSMIAAGTNNNVRPDMLLVEFAKPSDDGVNGITNISKANWRHHPQRRNSHLSPVTNVPALTIYGGGGYLVGFLETDKDSALAFPNSGLSKDNALRADFYDSGYDLEFKKYFVSIPDTFIDWRNDGARNFRFRIKNHSKHTGLGLVGDDDDAFFVDNVRLTFPSKKTDIAVSSVRIDWKYSITPASQLTNVPIIVKVSNNTSLTSAGFNIKVKVYRDSVYNKDLMEPIGDAKPIYCRLYPVPNLNGSTEIEIKMPDINLRKFGPDNYLLMASVEFPGGDLFPSNDVTYSNQYVGFGEVYAYESDLNQDSTGKILGSNHVPIEANIIARGLNLPASNAGFGIGLEHQTGAGVITDPYAGKIAMKFNVLNTDTIQGYNTYFAGNNYHPDLVEFIMYENTQDANGNDVPSNTIVPGSFLEHKRGWFNGGQLIFDEYMLYPLNDDIELTAGTYWIVLSQIATDGMNLGASATRMGMKVSNYTTGSGVQYIHTDRAFKKLVDNNYENDNMFTFANGNEGDPIWVPFTPNIGDLAYPHTDRRGNAKVDGVTNTFANGSWIPMIQPYFGPRAYGYGADDYEECPDDKPVELSSFNGYSKEAGIELIWATSSEINNAGFDVERRIKGNQEWQTISFVEGAGNSTSQNYYSHLDANVKTGNTYFYRLREVNKDGTASCERSNTISVKYETNGLFVLEQNSPNPFENNTIIRFELPTTSLVKLEVIDMYGKVVKVLVNGELNAGMHPIMWNGIDETGKVAISGTYLYRLTSGQNSIVKKLTILR